MKRIAATLAAMGLAVSCMEPLSTEKFIRGEGPYSFTVDMSDSTAVYCLDFYTRVDARECPPSLPVVISWTSPSDSVYSESGIIPLIGRRSVFSTDIYAPFMVDVSPYESGVWTLGVVPMAQLPKGFRGLGLVVSKKR